VRDAIIVAISAIGLVGCVVFIIAYHRRSGGRWRYNEVGIWFMLSRINLGLIFAILLSNRLFGDWPGRSETIIFLTALFALQTFWPSKFIWRTPYDHSHQRGKEKSSDSRT
jgi:hypothetical protein